MGNNIGTRTDDLCLYVQTNQPYYNARSLVDGAVYIDVYRPVNAYSLMLRIKGVERVKWEELRDSSRAGTAGKITEKQKDKIENFRLEVPLFQIGGTLNPGQYQFPFAFQLPEHLPGSFGIKHLDYDGRVRYALTAVLTSADSRQPVKCRTELIVRQQPQMANYNAPVVSEQSVCVCCVSKGRCKLECCFQSDTYQPGQDAILMCRADNRLCTVAVKSFNVSLLQHITFRTRAGKDTHFTRSVAQSSYPGIAAGAENLASPQLMTLKLEDPEAKREAGKIVLQPNVHGQLLECRYDLEVRPVFDAPFSCCAQVPVSTIPMHIYAPPVANWVPTMPATFHPRVYDINQIVIPLPGIKLEVTTPMVPAVSVSPAVSVAFQAHVDAPMAAATAELAVSQPHVDVTVPAVAAHVDGMQMHMDVGGAAVRMDMPAPTMEISNAEVEVSGEASQVFLPNATGSAGNVTVSADINMPTVSAKLNF